MAEVTPAREVKAIQEEYQKYCGLAGEAQFKIKALEADLFEFNKKLVALHQEYNDAAKAAAEKKEEA